MNEPLWAPVVLLCIVGGGRPGFFPGRTTGIGLRQPIAAVECEFMSETITLDRTGQVPLRFSGQLLAESESKLDAGPLQKRWHQIRVYRTDGGSLILAVRFNTLWPNESQTDAAQVCADNSDLVKALSEYDPCSGWQGHPAGARGAEKKNAILRQTITDAYRRCVGVVLGKLDIVEEVR